jgi:hypothetical protein
MTTRNSITEQIQRLYGKSVEIPISHKQLIRKEELNLLVNQIANEMLSLTVKESLNIGDLSIPSCMIATYTNNTVSQEDGRYFTTLPVYPIQVKRNIGVWSVIPQTGSYPNLSDGTPFIPITQEDWDLLRATDEGLLEDQTGFYVEGRKIFFTKSVAVPVKLKLLISDLSLIGDNEPYPISADMESALIARALEYLIKK